MTAGALPPGFEDLEPLLAWSLDSMEARRDQRIQASMDELEAFYDAMLPRMEAIMVHLDKVNANAIEGADLRLMNLAMTLAEIAPAVEQFFEPTISYGYDVTRFAQGVRE